MAMRQRRSRSGGTRSSDVWTSGNNDLLAIWVLEEEEEEVVVVEVWCGVVEVEIVVDLRMRWWWLSVEGWLGGNNCGGAEALRKEAFFTFPLSCAEKAQTQSQGTVKLHRIFLSRGR
ncbi:unnamed protein product [Fraxinus pennsylvanica]|uniref:Uncharacterized protein n=1 Tax=Fraxinus pennsylvanica TaxID=56036 RepID=A0AAD1Z7Z9_9LAMI|nr:unnamed protein product [Fraxinus pennsylvanica]